MHQDHVERRARVAAVVSYWPIFPVLGSGRARQLCPDTSGLDFLRNLNSIINLDAKISNGALDLRVSKQELDRTQVAGSPVDQCRLGSAEVVRSELERSRPILAIH